MGLTVPRPAVQLIQTDNGIQALGVERPKLNITAGLTKYSDYFLSHHKNISGIIFKSRSPSCGLGSTPLYNQDAKPTGFTSGLFAASLQYHWPELPMIEESQLDNNWQWFVFICYLFNDANQYQGKMLDFFNTHLKQLTLPLNQWNSFADLPLFYQQIKAEVDYKILFRT